MAEQLTLGLVFEASGSADAVFLQLDKNAKKFGKKAGTSFKKGFKDAVSGLKKFSLAGISDTTKSLLGSFGLVAGFQALKSAIAGAFNEFRQFSRATAEVNSILLKNQKLTEQTTDTFIKFSRQFGTSASQQAKAFYTIVSAGVKGTVKQLKTLRVANQAAVAGLVDINTSARALVSSVNAYASAGLTATKASDDLFIAVREGQTTFRELADFMGNVSPLASSAGVKFNELAGAIAAITKGGVETSKATIGLRSAIAAVIKPSEDAIKVAKRLGIEFTTAALRTKGLAGFLKDVGEKTGGSEAALSKLFGNIRGLSAILKIVTGDFGDFVRIQNEVKNSSGATRLALADISKSLDFKLSQVTSDFKAFGLNLVKSVLPAISLFVRGLKSITGGFNNLNSSLSKAPPSTYTQQLTKNVNEARRKLVDLTENGLKAVEKAERASGKTRLLLRIKLQRDIAAARKVLDFELERRSKASGVTQLTAAQELADSQKKIAIRKSEAIKKAAVDLDLELSKLGELSLMEASSLRDKDIENLRAALTTKIGVDQEGKDIMLINQQAFNEKMGQIELAQAEKTEAILAASAARSTGAFIGRIAGFKKFAAEYGISLTKMGKITNDVVAKGIGKSFAAMGAAFKNGENAGQAFIDGMKNIVAELAGTFGDYFIKQGVGFFASGDTARGGALIAAGAGLKVFSGFLGGGGGGGGGGAEASAESPSINSAPLQEQEGLIAGDEQRGEIRQISVNIQGDVFDSDETGTRIVQIINDNFEEKGGTINNASFA